MKLLELAKKNLQEYISVKETLELISSTQQTPLSYVASFLISQGFETNIPTYDVDKYYSIHSNDDWNWGVFQYTNSILSELANNEIYKDVFTFSDNDLLKNLENAYWKRNQLYNLELIKNLSIDFYFRVQDIKIIAQYTSYDSKSCDSKESFSSTDVRELLKNGISSYMLGSAEKYNLIDDFVSSSLIFFDCNHNNHYEIQTDDLKKLFFDNLIIIKGFNDFLPENYQTNNRNIWDEDYLNILKNDMSDLKEIDPDIYMNESINFENEPISQEIKKHPLFLKNRTFSIHEATCLMAEYDPIETQWDYQNVNWLMANTKYEQASNFIFSAVRTNLFEEFSNGEHFITSDNLKILLNESNHFIDGFNKESIVSNNENLIENTKLKNTIANLELDVAIEQVAVKELNAEIEKLEQENKRLKIELSEKVSLDYLDLTPEQEIPNARQRNNVLRIISILSDMADLPPDEHFVAFNMMEAHAIKKCKEIPKKDTIANWLKESKKF